MITVKAQVKGVTANVAKKTISISFTIAMDEETLPKAEALAFYVDKTSVTLMVEPRQMNFNVLSDEKENGK